MIHYIIQAPKIHFNFFSTLNCNLSDDAIEESQTSFTNTYSFQVLTVSSFAGTFYMDYFFSFHLLNIVANNQLLKNVVKAVTQNGKLQEIGHLQKRDGNLL